MYTYLPEQCRAMLLAGCISIYLQCPDQANFVKHVFLFLSKKKTQPFCKKKHYWKRKQHKAKKKQTEKQKQSKKKQITGKTQNKQIKSQNKKKKEAKSESSFVFVRCLLFFLCFFFHSFFFFAFSNLFFFFKYILLQLNKQGLQELACIAGIITIYNCIYIYSPERWRSHRL